MMLWPMAGCATSEGRCLGVREYARLPGVSRVTVYRALARGEIGHVKVSSAIRLPVGVPRS